MLVVPAWVHSNTLHQNGVVLITLATFSAIAIDGHVAFFTVAVKSIGVEYLIFVASIAPYLRTVLDFDGGGFTSGTVIVVGPVAPVV